MEVLDDDEEDEDLYGPEPSLGATDFTLSPFNAPSLRSPDEPQQRAAQPVGRRASSKRHSLAPGAYVAGAITASVPSLAQLLAEDECGWEAAGGCASPSLMDMTVALGGRVSVAPSPQAAAAASPLAQQHWAPAAPSPAAGAVPGDQTVTVAMDLTCAFGGVLSSRQPSEPEAFAAAQEVHSFLLEDNGATMGFSAALAAGVHPRWGAQRRSMAPGDLTAPFPAVPEGDEAAEQSPLAEALAAAATPRRLSAAAGGESPSLWSALCAAPTPAQSTGAPSLSPPPPAALSPLAAPAALPCSPLSASPAVASPSAAFLSFHAPSPAPSPASRLSPLPAAPTPAAAASPPAQLPASPRRSPRHSPAAVAAAPASPPPELRVSPRRSPRASPAAAAAPAPPAAAASAPTPQFHMGSVSPRPTPRPARLSAGGRLSTGGRRMSAGAAPAESPAAAHGSPQPLPAAALSPLFMRLAQQREALAGASPSPAAAIAASPAALQQLPAASPASEPRAASPFSPREFTFAVPALAAPASPEALLAASSEAMDLDSPTASPSVSTGAPESEKAQEIYVEPVLMTLPAAASPAAALSPVAEAMEEGAALSEDIFDFRMPSATANAVISGTKIAAAAAAASASPLGAPASVTRGSMLFSPSLALGRYASMQPLGATPTRDETMDVMAGGAGVASPDGEEGGDDTLFAFRTSPGGQAGVAEEMDEETPPLVGQGPPSMMRARRSTGAVPAETTIFSYDPDSTAETGAQALPPRSSATDDSLFASTVSWEAQAAQRAAALAAQRRSPSPLPAGSPVDEEGLLDSTGDTQAYAAALKAKLAAMLNGTPTGDTSLEPPSRSPTPVHGFFGGPTPGGGASVLRGLPVAPQPLASALVQPGLPRRSMGGAALRRASFMPQPHHPQQQQQQTVPASIPRPAPPPSTALARPPLSYAALCESMGVSWKDHVRARRSSVMPCGLGAAAPPSTLDQALRLWCITAPEVEAQDALREALEREWEAAADGVAAATARIDQAPPKACFDAARADEATLAAMREDAKAMQRACKAAAKGRAAQLRAAANGELIEKLRGNVTLLDEHLDMVASAKIALEDVAAGIATMAASAAPAPAVARPAASATMQAAQLSARLSAHQAALAAAQENTATAEARLASLSARRTQVQAALANAQARLARATGRPTSATAAADAASAHADAAAATAAAAAALDRGAEADILAKVSGWRVTRLGAESVSLELSGAAFCLHASFEQGGAGVSASAEVLPAPAGAPLRGRGAPERIALAAQLAAPLTAHGARMPEALQPLALRCGRATDALLELDACVAAYPRLASIACGEQLPERTLVLSFVLLQPVQRKLIATLTLPPGADPYAHWAVDVAARIGADGMRAAADIGARCAAVAPGLRRIARIAAVLDEELLAGVDAA